MYEIEEFYAVDGKDLKDLLKECIFNYYIKNKDKILKKEELQNQQMHNIIEATDKQEILSMKGAKYVQNVQ